MQIVPQIETVESYGISLRVCVDGSTARLGEGTCYAGRNCDACAATTCLPMLPSFCRTAVQPRHRTPSRSTTPTWRAPCWSRFGCAGSTRCFTSLADDSPLAHALRHGTRSSSQSCLHLSFCTAPAGRLEQTRDAQILTRRRPIFLSACTYVRSSHPPGFGFFHFAALRLSLCALPAPTRRRSCSWPMRSWRRRSTTWAAARRSCAPSRRSSGTWSASCRSSGTRRRAWGCASVHCNWCETPVCLAL